MVRHVINLPGLADANRKLDLILAGGVAPAPPTLDNTLSGSELLPTQVAGADDLYAAREAAMDAREARIVALENA